jgi:hypothetical protein
MRTGFGQSRTIHQQDGAIEPIAREDSLQVFRRMVGGKTNVGVYAQED